MSLEEKRRKNREAQRKFSKTEKGKKYIREKYKKWVEKKKEADPNYFKKSRKNRAEYFKAYHAKKRKENPEKVKKKAREAQRKFSQTEKGKKYNKEKLKKWLKDKRENDPKYFKKFYVYRKEYLAKYRRKQLIENPEKVRQRNRKGAKNFYLKTKKVPKYIILRRLRGKLWDTMNSIKLAKKVSSRKLLGCSINEFKLYLESRFKKNMTWDNYGKWHIDHIKPISKFDLTIEEEQKKCFHFTNLQPLWALDNIRKSNKY